MKTFHRNVVVAGIGGHSAEPAYDPIAEAMVPPSLGDALRANAGTNPIMPTTGGVPRYVPPREQMVGLRIDDPIAEAMVPPSSLDAIRAMRRAAR